MSEYWDKRAENYNSFQRVVDLDYQAALYTSVVWNKEDYVLDVGCGTGIMSDGAAVLTKKVFGIDASQGMIDQNSSFYKNKTVFKHDIRDPLFIDECFDKVIARMVFHYVTEDTKFALSECYRVLKKGGKIIFSESVPMKEELKEHYAEIFKHREPRLTYTSTEWFDMILNAGFCNFQTKNYISELCLEDWVSDTTEEKAKAIMDLHLNASEDFKKAYNLREKDGKHYIDIRKIIIVGEK